MIVAGIGNTHENAGGGARATGERLCYYCNEGHCALCTGWDRTVIEGRVVEVPCAHGCREAQRKPNQRVSEAGQIRIKRA